MIKINKFTSYPIRRPDLPNQYGFTVQKWKRSDWIKYRLYHAYDMKFPIRLPGWHSFERWLRQHGAENYAFMRKPKRYRLRDRLLSWTAEQDARCFNLSSRHETLYTVKAMPHEAWEQLP